MVVALLLVVDRRVVVLVVELLVMAAGAVAVCVGAAVVVVEKVTVTVEENWYKASGSIPVGMNSKPLIRQFFLVAFISMVIPNDVEELI